MNNTSPLKLKLPERTTAASDSLFLNIKEVEAWVSGLPIANTGETSKQAFRTLVELNRVDIPNINRITIANMLLPMVRHIAFNLKKYYLDVSIPLAAKNQKVVVLCRELQIELANCYKIIIARMVSGQGEPLERRMMTVALHQAIHYLSKALYFSVIVYNPYPENAWREIHQLYLFAEQNSLTEILLKDGNDSRDQGSSIRDIYQDALLLALASPYGLRQKEIEELFLKLPIWAKHLRMSAMQSTTDDSGLFFIDAESDNPPLHILTRTDDQASEHCRILDTQGLIQHLRLELKAIYADHSEGSIFTREMQTTAPLLRKVIESLTHDPQRKFIRTNLHFEFDTAIGISDIYTLITANSSEPEPAQEPDEPEHTDKEVQKDPNKSSFLDIKLSNDDDSLQIVPMDYPVDGLPYFHPQKMLDNVIEDSGAPDWTKQTHDDKVDTFSCKTINESAGGYCINWKGENAPKVKVGELIGIQSASDHSQFSIGVARWLKNVPETGLQLGFEIISPSSEAVKMHTAANKYQASIAQKCIMLPRNTATNRPASLILPIMNIHAGEDIKIENAGKKRPARLVRLLESTGTFSQYEFVYMDKNT